MLNGPNEWLARIKAFFGKLQVLSLLLPWPCISPLQPGHSMALHCLWYITYYTPSDAGAHTCSGLSFEEAPWSLPKPSGGRQSLLELND